MYIRILIFVAAFSMALAVPAFSRSHQEAEVNEKLLALGTLHPNPMSFSETREFIKELTGYLGDYDTQLWHECNGESYQIPYGWRPSGSCGSCSGEPLIKTKGYTFIANSAACNPTWPTDQCNETVPNCMWECSGPSCPIETYEDFEELCDQALTNPCKYIW